MLKVIQWAICWMLLLGSVFAASLGIAFPLLQQATVWLETAEVPTRDLYWFVAPSLCPSTGGRGMGWEGKEICRVDYIEFTDMLGLNQLLNWVFGLHISVTTCVAIVIVWLIALPIVKDEIYEL